MMFSALKDNLTNSDDDLEDREDIDWYRIEPIN
jgi:hypothetical protein